MFPSLVPQLKKLYTMLNLLKNKKKTSERNQRYHPSTLKKPRNTHNWTHFHFRLHSFQEDLGHMFRCRQIKCVSLTLHTEHCKQWVTNPHITPLKSVRADLGHFLSFMRLSYLTSTGFKQGTLHEEEHFPTGPIRKTSTLLGHWDFTLEKSSTVNYVKFLGIWTFQ